MQGYTKRAAVQEDAVSEWVTAGPGNGAAAFARGGITKDDVVSSACWKAQRACFCRL